MNRAFFIVSVLILAICPVLPAQQAGVPTPTVQKDPQALGILAQALTAGGGVSALGMIGDYTASGTVTYYWGGKEVPGSVTVKGRGTGQFLLEASLPQGPYKVVVSNGTGSVTSPNGSHQTLEYGNTVNFGSLTFPLSYLTAAPGSSTTSIVYVGLETVEGAQVHHIRMQQIPQAQNSSTSSNNNFMTVAAQLSTRDFYVDPATFQIVSTLDSVHPKDKSQINIRHELKFSNYKQSSGILVPFSIDEFVYGQHTWSIQLSQISFNGGLTDSTFTP